MLKNPLKLTKSLSTTILKYYTAIYLDTTQKVNKTIGNVQNKARVLVFWLWGGLMRILIHWVSKFLGRQTSNVAAMYMQMVFQCTKLPAKVPVKSEFYIFSYLQTFFWWNSLFWLTLVEQLTFNPPSIVNKPNRMQ